MALTEAHLVAHRLLFICMYHTVVQYNEICQGPPVVAHGSNLHCTKGPCTYNIAFCKIPLVLNNNGAHGNTFS